MPSIINLIKESGRLIKTNLVVFVVVPVIFAGISLALPFTAVGVFTFLGSSAKYLGGLDLSVLLSLVIRYFLSIEGLAIFYILHKRGSLVRIIGSSLWARIIIFFLGFIPLMFSGVLAGWATQAWSQDMNPNLSGTMAVVSLISGFIISLAAIVVSLAFAFVDYLIVNGFNAASAVGIDLVYLKKHWKYLLLVFSPVILIYVLIHSIVPAVLIFNFGRFAANNYLFLGFQPFDLLILNPLIIAYTITIFHSLRLTTDLSKHSSFALINCVYIATITVIILLAILPFAKDIPFLLDPKNFSQYFRF